MDARLPPNRGRGRSALGGIVWFQGLKVKSSELSSDRSW
jgi:hypothetical protein